MITTPLKTHKITIQDKNIFPVLDKWVPRLKEGSILAVTSKIVAICEGRVVAQNLVKKKDLIKQEADCYLPPEESKYNITLTIKNNLLIPAAGIDESNGNGYYVLWPSNPQKWANKIRQYLKVRFSLKKVGVIITDSKTSPLRWGTTGVAIAHSGFSPLNDYIEKPDIFGRHLKVTKANVMDSLAAAAVAVMGEGKEQTPLAIIESLPFVKFRSKNPTKEELDQLHINLKDDLYAPLLQRAPWKK